MKISYLANIRIPTDRAHGIQIMKTCEALSLQGVVVEIIVPSRKNNIKENPFSYYKVKENFTIKTLNCPDLIDYGKLGGFVQYFIFTVKVLFYCLKSDSDIFYSRDEMPLWFLGLFNKKVFWEVHTGKWNFLVSGTVKMCNGIITISNGIKKYFENKGVGGGKILVSPDAVDIEQFSLDIKKDDARKKIGLPLDKKIILYTGHLYAWKGADTLANAVAYFNEEYLFVFVGGNINHINDFKKRLTGQNNIIVLGQKPHEDIPLYLKSADVLIIPNSGKEDVSRLYTSPMKLFEYMASGTPIVASNLPSIREILDEDGAVFFEPDNPESLARSIKKVFDNPALADKMANISRENSQKYSWSKRAEKIYSFLLKNGIKK